MKIHLLAIPFVMLVSPDQHWLVIMALLRFLKIPVQMVAPGILKQSGRQKIEPSENALSMGGDVKLFFGSETLVAL